MRTTNEHIGGGLWPEMYGTSESHISPVVLYSIRKALFCLKRVELFLLSTTFLSFLDDGRGTFSCDDVDGILCCVICCILNDGWLLAASLAASCHRIKTTTTDRTFFKSCRNTTKWEKQQDLPGSYYSYVSIMNESSGLDLYKPLEEDFIRFVKGKFCCWRLICSLLMKCQVFAPKEEQFVG